MKEPISLEAALNRRAVERRQRQRIVLIAVPALLGALLWIWISGQTEVFFREYSPFPKDLYLAVLISLFGISGLALVMTYLQTGFKQSTEFIFASELMRRSASEADANERASLASLTKGLQSDLDHARSEIDRALSLATNVGKIDREALINDLKMQIRSEAADSLIADMKANIASAHKKELRDKELFVRFEESKARLSRELEALSRRGNLNLALGAVTTVIGLSLLGLSVFQEVTASKDMWTFASHFVPRLTLVLMIELFAYFFLSLYKTSLQEIKYFQNEMTNVESKQIALRAALDAGDQSMIASMVSSLAATERNHVLSKDQTTVELEKAKIDREGRSDVAKYLSEILQKKT
ncbi:hypothetical protein EDF72_1718 [Delftia acidovorans]|uniref:hypothetical protein n=1 Tax=Delftia acidovorans TaxID=80866 RepID=UPI000FAB30A1|nr:hypothetical protein [Delftia acidovorans]ROR02584.1 hypothetical protein EDF72_1718 [Delftia acidovorans]